MSNAQWYFGRDGAQGGPVNEAEVRRKLAAGELRRTDLVWRDGMVQWQPAGEVAEFAATVAGLTTPGAAAPPLVPPPIPPQARPSGPYAEPGAPLGYAGPQRGYPGQPPHDIGQDAGMRMLLPVGRSGWAIASGYLGLLSVFPLVGILFGLGAIITGLLAVRDIKRNPHRHGMGRAIFGIVMGALFSVLYIIMFGAMIADNRL